MTLPNKLTILRILMVPFLVLLPFIFSGTTLVILEVGVFVLASITDFFDGYLARKLNLITTFGKFMDPLADKLLVLAALIMQVEQGIIPAWIVIIIAGREFMVSGVRLLAAGDGTVIAASNLGKYKTASTMVAIVLVWIPAFLTVGYYVMGLAVFFTIISGADYFMKNKELVLKSK